MRTDKFFKEVCSKINEIDELLRVTISWSRVMQLNPDTTINGENGDSISEKWESVAKGVDDLANDINCLRQEELLQVADMIATLRQRFRVVEKRKKTRTKAFDIYIERETSHERRVQRIQSHGYWQYIFDDMRLVVDALSGTLRNINDAPPQPAEEEPLQPIAGTEAEQPHKIRGRKPYDAKGFFDRLENSRVKDRDAFVKAIKAVIEDMPLGTGKGAYMYMVMFIASRLGYFHKSPNYYEVVRALKIEESDTDRKGYETTAIDYGTKEKALSGSKMKLSYQIVESIKRHLQEFET